MESLTNEQRLLQKVLDAYCGGVKKRLAEKIGRSDTYVGRLFYPKDKPHHKGIGPEIMDAVRKAFAGQLPFGFWEMDADTVDLPWAPTEKEYAPKNQSVMIASEPFQYPARMDRLRSVVVVGKASCGLSERIWTDGDYPVGATDEYAEISTTDNQAFLVEIDNTSMMERYCPGEFALVEPGTSIEAGCDVLVRLRTGESMIKRLDNMYRGYQLRSLNGGEVAFYRIDEVNWIYYVSHPVPRRKIKSRH